MNILWWYDDELVFEVNKVWVQLINEIRSPLSTITTKKKKKKL